MLGYWLYPVVETLDNKTAQVFLTLVSSNRAGSGDPLIGMKDNQ